MVARVADRTSGGVFDSALRDAQPEEATVKFAAEVQAEEFPIESEGTLGEELRDVFPDHIAFDGGTGRQVHP